MSDATGPVEIVLTGGPCSGKTASLRYLVEHLSARGWRVLVVPEAATMLISGGIHDLGRLAVHDRETYLKVQEDLVLLQSDLRDRFRSLADAFTGCSTGCSTGRSTGRGGKGSGDHADGCCGGAGGGGPRTVLIYDRAELDNRAYMEPEEFTAVLHNTLERSPAQVSARYDAVIHLVTAADGAPEAYTTANNEARTETIDQAVALDRAVQDAWLGHPHLIVVGNTASFDQKLTRTLAAVLNVLGEPEPVEVERKWLLAAPPPVQVLSRAVPVDIEQVYLPTDATGAERRVRARTHGGHTTYFHTLKTPTTSPAGRVEHETMISAGTYRLLASMQAPGTSVVRKRRYCFVSHGQHFELDHLIAPVDVWLLEAELVSATDEVRLPEALNVDREVTDDLLWRNSALARATGHG